MKTFTNEEYILIQLANAAGLDKLTYEERLAKAEEVEAPSNPLWFKTKEALHHYRRGEAIGLPIWFDAISSGLQLLSLISRDRQGMELTGTVKPKGKEVRPNPYKQIQQLLGLEEVPYEDVKKAVMTHFYGSSSVPKRVFQEHLPRFLKTVNKLFSGAAQIRDAAVKAWDPKAKSYQWTMPDGFHVYLPVTTTVERQATLEDYSLTLRIRETQMRAQPFGLSIAANWTHSVDAYLLRTILRHTNYDKEWLLNQKSKIEERWNTSQWLGRDDGQITDLNLPVDSLSEEEAVYMYQDIEDTLSYPSFSVLTVHDCFAALPKHMNRLRRQANRAYAQLYKDPRLERLLTRVTGFKPKRFSPRTYAAILEADYALT